MAQTCQSVRFTFLVAALLLIGTAVPDAWAQKGKGGGGGTGGGTIYFINSPTPSIPYNATWSMNSDGSAITQVGAWAWFTYPSRILHNGHRWFLSVRPIPDSYYPDGKTQRAEVFAHRDDYHYQFNDNSDTKVQLTDDSTLQTVSNPFYDMQWLADDQSISFKARRWSELGVVVEGGLYTLDVGYDAFGKITPLTTPAMVLDFPLDDEGLPSFTSASWNPTATQVVYINTEVNGLWVADLVLGTFTLIHTGQAASPDWSPDGTKIAFVDPGAGSIYTITPTGAGLKRIVRPTNFENVYWRFGGHLRFSPDGDHIVFAGIASNNDVFRATSSGRSLTNLTKTDSINEVPTGWR